MRRISCRWPLFPLVSFSPLTSPKRSVFSVPNHAGSSGDPRYAPAGNPRGVARSIDSRTYGRVFNHVPRFTNEDMYTAFEMNVGIHEENPDDMVLRNVHFDARKEVGGRTKARSCCMIVLKSLRCFGCMNLCFFFTF